MDYAELVRRASRGEVIAFVELTRRFQHAALGSALALIGDFQQAEDVVQRPAPGIVRGLAKSPAGGLPRGSTVLSSGRHTRIPFDPAEFAELVPSLAAEAPVGQRLRLLETGIKVIDVMCPLVAGGTVAIAGDLGVAVLLSWRSLCAG